MSAEQRGFGWTEMCAREQEVDVPRYSSSLPTPTLRHGVETEAVLFGVGGAQLTAIAAPVFRCGSSFVSS